MSTEQFYNIYDSEGFLELFDNIYRWGIDREITFENGATGISQLKKLREEFDELEEGLVTGEVPKIRDSIGDMIVVLQQIARLEGIPIQTCLEDAWEDIKDRTGVMRHGVFVKQADIELIGEEVLNASKNAEDLRGLIAFAKDNMGKGVET